MGSSGLRRPFEGFEARDTGIAAATGGLAAARVVRSSGESISKVPGHSCELQFLFILRGELGVDIHSGGDHNLQAGDSCVIPAGEAHTLRADPDLEMLEVNLPA